jgi:subtilase family serine protease
VTYVAAAGPADDDFVDALTKITDGHLADIVSNSWVIGADTGVPAVAAFQQVFLQGAAEGIGFAFASGDDGSQAASADGTGPLQTGTNYPASDPWVTAVGGTSLAIDAAGSYRWETGYETDYAPLADDGTTWTELPGHFSGGAGGGPSGVFARPDYQRKTIPPSAFKLGGTARRVVPDVAMDADPVTGMRVGQTFNLPTGSVYAEYASGGTSLATPLFAGVQALAQQHAGHPLGFANPALYRAGAGAFRDVPALPAGTHPDAVHVLTSIGNDGTITNTFVLASLGRAQDTGLAVTAGYDAVTGLGSPTGRYVNSAR